MVMEIRQAEFIIHHLIQDDKGGDKREVNGRRMRTNESGLLKG
jgi:hypothetical protein